MNANAVQPPSLAERRREAGRQLMRSEILAAAEDIVRSQGMDALSLRAIAKAVGVSAPALYEYFPNKDAILRGLFVQGSRVMLDRMNEVISDEPRGLVTLLDILQGYRTFARDEPDYFRLLFGTVDPNLALTDDEYQSIETIFLRFIEVIADAIERGELRPLPLEPVSCALWALVHGVAQLETDSFLARKEHREDEHGVVFDAAIDMTLRCFATAEGQAIIDARTVGDTFSEGR